MKKKCIFGDFIKSIRKNKGYSQSDFVTKLQLANSEFRSVDSVTVSRWERGVTKPNPAKAVRILRCFTLDLTPFLKSLDVPFSPESVDAFLFHRFESNLQRYLFAALEYETPTNSTQISHDKLLLEVNDPMLEKVKSFNRRWNNRISELFQIDLLLYQESSKLIGYRFFDSKNKGKYLGFSIGMLFNNEILIEQIRCNKGNVNFSLASNYNKDTTLALYLFSGNISSRYVFLHHWRLRLQYLSSHSNITEIYCYVNQNLTAKFLESLGFLIVSAHDESEMGEIRLGNKSYDSCIMKVDTSIFLTRKEVLAFFK